MKMKYFSLSFSCALLFATQSAQAIPISKSVSFDRRERDADYIYLNKNRSKLSQVVADISSWDEDKNSPVCQLNKYIADGHSVALKEVVLETLAYAESVVEKYGNKISLEQQSQINEALNIIANEIENGDLNDALNMLAQEIENGALSLVIVDRNCCSSIIKIREKLFDRNATISGTLSVGDLVVISCLHSACVDNLSVVDESVSGTLSVSDAVIGSADVGCDLTVGCNISMSDSVSGAIGNIIKDSVPFIHTYPAGSSNTFVGQNVGNFTMTGTQNVGFGAATLINNTTGSGNTAVGFFALGSNTIGQHNTVMGTQALLNNSTDHSIPQLVISQCLSIPVVNLMWRLVILLCQTM